MGNSENFQLLLLVNFDNAVGFWRQKLRLDPSSDQKLFFAKFSFSPSRGDLRDDVLLSFSVFGSLRLGLLCDITE